MQGPSQWSALEQWAALDRDFAREVQALPAAWFADDVGHAHSKHGHRQAEVQATGTLASLLSMPRCRCATVTRAAGTAGVALASHAQEMLAFLGGSAEWAVQGDADPGRVLTEAHRCMARLGRAPHGALAQALEKVEHVAHRARASLTSASSRTRHTQGAAVEVLRRREGTPLSALRDTMAVVEGSSAHRMRDFLVSTCDGSELWQERALLCVGELATAARFDERALSDLPGDAVARRMRDGLPLGRAVTEALAEELGRHVVAVVQWFSSAQAQLECDPRCILAVASTDVVATVEGEYEAYRVSTCPPVLLTPFAVGQHLVLSGSPGFFPLPYAVLTRPLSPAEMDVAVTLIGDALAQGTERSLDLPELIESSRRLAA